MDEDFMLMGVHPCKQRHLHSLNGSDGTVEAIIQYECEI